MKQKLTIGIILSLLLLLTTFTSPVLAKPMASPTSKHDLFAPPQRLTRAAKAVAAAASAAYKASRTQAVRKVARVVFFAEVVPEAVLSGGLTKSSLEHKLNETFLD